MFLTIKLQQLYSLTRSWRHHIQHVPMCLAILVCSRMMVMMIFSINFSVFVLQNHS